MGPAGRRDMILLKGNKMPTQLFRVLAGVRFYPWGEKSEQTA